MPPAAAREGGETGAPSHCPPDSVPQTPAGDCTLAPPLRPRLWQIPCTLISYHLRCFCTSKESEIYSDNGIL